ncbi:efflux RND transporter periplasmic adaptor subunit [Desulfuromonas sp. TF]|uniref:efflux RND transporter periplasmic adaptor subunit n=1 Tax=Desulfuromonas sp. TF TaxID=1232410 RepID=UPI00041D67EC|nr:efflux RND transporter periplasmic adaptor subunit [Desulfuromonas sp. TF]
MPPMRTLLLLLLLPCSAFAQPGENSLEKGPPPALIVTDAVTEDTVRPPLALVGTAEPRRLAEVAAQTDGLVESLEARKGDTVSRGDALVRLRTLPVQLQLQETRARLAETRDRIGKARGDLRRARQLFDQKFISEEELEARSTDLSALENQAEQFRAAVRIMEDRLARMTVRAPFSGQVVEEKTETGQWLAEGDTIVELADLGVIHVTVQVPEKHISEIGRGTPAEVTFDALTGRTFPGEVSAVVPRADPASRTFPVEIAIDNPHGKILAGMLARVTFHLGAPQTVLLIPKDALIPQPQGGGRIFKVTEGQAKQVTVDILGAYGDRYALKGVDGNLAPGDRVVVRGNERLRSGQAVTERQPE